MKKLSFLSVLISIILSYQMINAQTGAQMQIYRTGGSVDTYNLSDIDSITFIPCTTNISCGSSLTDSRDGKVYRTCQIGTQCWMRDNLNYGKFIYSSTPQTNNGIVEKYCYNDDLTSCASYGGLYKWYEAMNYDTIPGIQAICPAGWHFPTDKEVQTLEIAVGLPASEAGLVGWRGNIGAALTIGGSSGFDEIYGGYFNANYMEFLNYGEWGYWWTSNQAVPNYSAMNRAIDNSQPGVDRGVTAYQTDAEFVRCIKDLNSK